MYVDETGRLYNASNQELISEGVNSYNILGNFVFYSTKNGLFIYDIIQSSLEQILTMDDYDGYCQMINKIQIYNNQLFLDIETKWSPPEPMNCLYVFNLNNRILKPLINIEIEETQKFYCKEMGYELSYPVGFVIQFDPGSYFSGYTLFSDPTNGVFIRVMNHGYFYGHIDSALHGTEITTNEGITGYYNITVDEETFMFTCTTANDFQFIAEGNIEYFEYAKEIFFTMIKSFRTLNKNK